MAHDIDDSTFRVLGPNGNTIGKGFLVSQNLAVTCAHVVEGAKATKRNTIHVQFTGQKQNISAYDILEYWLDTSKGDVAFLQLQQTPAGIHHLRLSPASDCKGSSTFRSFGYATAAGILGILLTELFR